MTETLEAPAIEKPEIILFRKQDVAIAEMADKYLPLKINGLDDKEGFKAVHEARMIVKNTRVAVEKKRKELKADALEYGRKVDAEAKRLTELLEPIESHLSAEEDAVVAERDRIKREAEEAKRKALQARLDSMLAVGVVASPAVVEPMTDEAFAISLAEATKAFEERRRVEAEAAEKRRQEEAAIAEERAALAKIKAEQDAEAARLAAERKKIEDEQAIARHAAEIEKARQEAAEKARIETEQRLAREAAAKKAAEDARIAREKAAAEAAEASRIKAESERPQREKLLAVADAVDKIDVPTGPGSTAVEAELERCSNQIRLIAKGPLEN